MKTLLTLVVGIVLLYALGVVLASTLGGENVVLRTTDANGDVHQTRLWIQDMDRSEWLRSGSPKNRWYQRLTRRPQVEVKRNGQWRRYRAIPVPQRTAELNSAMARTYGWADWLIGLTQDRDAAVAIRLEPVGG
jgi:hypothetical protein